MTDLIEPDEALREEFRASINRRAVIVRTESAGVHFGYLVEKADTLAGTQVLLVRARRIWQWVGAWTLSEVATLGLDISRSKVAEPVACLIGGVIEILYCTDLAIRNLESAKWQE